MTLICISSALIALSGNGVGKDLQMMFGLNFEVTKPMIVTIALIGGGTLISSQYYLTKMMTKRAVGNKPLVANEGHPGNCLNFI